MWVGLALLAALFQVLRNMSMKHLGHTLDATINVWGRFTFIIPFLAVFVLWHGMPPLQPGFWWYVLLFGVTQTASTLSLSKALHYSDISIVTSLWKISLLFLILFAFLSLHETPSTFGLIGMLLSVVGVYLLNVQKSRLSLWAPLRELFVDRGLRYTLCSALLYAPAVILIKQIIVRSDVYFSNLMAYTAASLVMLPLALRRSSQHFVQVPRHWPAFVSLGLFACLSSVCQSLAYQMTLTSYVEAVKQVEILFALGIGYLVFQEHARVWAILPGSLVIMSGLILLHLGG
ncbi:MAG: DMT family transporter [Candidatus Tectimicrobiota bacterium]